MCERASPEDVPEGAMARENERIFDAFRRWGYLAANLDPLGFFRPPPPPDLAFSGAVSSQARRFTAAVSVPSLIIF